MSEPNATDLRNTIGFLRWWRQFCSDHNVTFKDGFVSDARFDADSEVVIFRFLSISKRAKIDYHWDMEFAFCSSMECVPTLEKELIGRIKKLKQEVEA